MAKIILLRPKIGFGLGGAESHAANVAINLLDRGYEIGVIAHTISFPENVLRRIEVLRVRYQGFGSLPKHILFIEQAKTILEKHSTYKLLSFFRYPYPSDLFILCDPMIAFLKKQRSQLFGPFSLRYKVLAELEKRALLAAKGVVSLFSLGKALIKEFYPDVYPKTTVCYRGMDFKRFNPSLKTLKDRLKAEYGFSKQDFLILFVGYDVKRKGLTLLLEVLPELPKKVKILICGAKGCSTERIFFLGKVKDVGKFYALADLFVLPTLYDPGALATLEALATGTPVITTSFDGTSEFIVDGLNGFVIERTRSSLKEAILKALEIRFDPQTIFHTVSHLTWDNYVDCLVSQLEGL